MLDHRICLQSTCFKEIIDAIARINQLHAPYVKSGNISNDDMLFVLSLFALEQWRWIDRHEWRTFTELELCALGTFWKVLGEALGVEYERLRGAEKGWRDGLEWLTDLDTWGKEYQRKRMVPAKENKLLAEKTLDGLLWNVPETAVPLWSRGQAASNGSLGLLAPRNGPEFR